MDDIALATTPDDLAYVRGNYVPFPARGLPGETGWPGAHLPRATYRTADGTLWYPRDWWRLFDDAGGLAGVRALFERRLRAAAAMIDHPLDPSEEWRSYLAGYYGACLRDVTPETIVLKEALVARIERLLDEPQRLRGAVEMLDGLTRPFAACDRLRFGPTSRDRLITDVRRRFPQVFA